MKTSVFDSFEQQHQIVSKTIATCSEHAHYLVPAISGHKTDRHFVRELDSVNIIDQILFWKQTLICMLFIISW